MHATAHHQVSERHSIVGHARAVRWRVGRASACTPACVPDFKLGYSLMHTLKHRGFRFVNGSLFHKRQINTTEYRHLHHLPCNGLSCLVVGRKTTGDVRESRVSRTDLCLTSLPKGRLCGHRASQYRLSTLSVSKMRGMGRLRGAGVQSMRTCVRVRRRYVASRVLEGLEANPTENSEHHTSAEVP